MALTADTGCGYFHGHILGALHKAHRIIWLLATKEWPKEQIDHINGNRSDNRICNLRDASSGENGRNRKRQNDNKTGVSGVTWSNAHLKWRARIHVNGKRLHLGYYENIEDAIAVRKEAEAKYGYHPNHGRD